MSENNSNTIQEPIPQQDESNTQVIDNINPESITISINSEKVETNVVNEKVEEKVETKVEEKVETKVETKVEEKVETKVEEKVEEKPLVEKQPSAVESKVDIDKVIEEGFVELVAKYLDDGVIDNEELVDIVKCVMEIVEKKRDIIGADKKKVALTILRKFIADKVIDYDNLEKLFDKSIDLAVKVSKNGLETIKFTSDTIAETKSAFNLIYSSALSKINESYPLADDIINNIFDITLYILQLIEGQTSLSESEKKILLKKVIQKVINSLESKLTQEQRDFLLTQVEPTISLVQIGLRAQKGQFSINAEEVIGFVSCFTRCFSKCRSKKSAQK